MKINFIIVLFVSFLIAANANLKNNSALLVELSLYPTGNNLECYIVRIGYDRIYNIKYGTRNLKNQKNIELSSVKKEKEKLLSEKDMKILKQIVNKLNKQDSITKENILKGGWEIFIKTERNKINIYYNEINKYSEVVNELTKLIIKMSPIEIDIHSWS